MARPTLSHHRKFFRLQAKLKLARWGALGVLEALWQPSYECGEPTVGDALDVAARVGWDGEPEALAAALVECGFLDLEGGKYTIHDFWHHAPDYVRKRASREEARREKNDPRTKPPSPDGAPGNSPPDRSLTGHSPVTDPSPSGQSPGSDQSVTPTPLSHHPSLPVKIQENIASQSLDVPRCPGKPPGHPPKSGEANHTPLGSGKKARGNGGLEPIGSIAKRLQPARGDPADDLEAYICAEFPEISDHQRGLLRRLGLTLGGCYRVHSIWHKRRKEIPMDNGGIAYLYRMLETEARGVDHPGKVRNESRARMRP